MFIDPFLLGTCTSERRQAQAQACHPLEDTDEYKHAAAADAGDDEPVRTAADDDLDNIDGIADSNRCFGEHWYTVSNAESSPAAQCDLPIPQPSETQMLPETEKLESDCQTA